MTPSIEQFIRDLDARYPAIEEDAQVKDEYEDRKFDPRPPETDIIMRMERQDRIPTKWPAELEAAKSKHFNRLSEFYGGLKWIDKPKQKRGRRPGVKMPTQFVYHIDGAGNYTAQEVADILHAAVSTVGRNVRMGERVAGHEVTRERKDGSQ